MLDIACPSNFAPITSALTIGGERFGIHSTKAPYAVGQHKVYPEILRFEVRPGDNGGHEGGADKVELQQASRKRSSAAGRVRHSWAIMIPSGQNFPSDPRVKGEEWLILGQWHATEDTPELGRAQDDSLSPPIAYDFSGGVFRLITRTDANVLQRASRYPVKNIRYTYQNFPRDKWVYFSESIKFGWNGDAAMTLRMDGRVVSKIRFGQSIGYNDLVMPHFNFGIYRNKGYTEPFVALYANQRFSPKPGIRAGRLPDMSSLCEGRRSDAK